MKRVKIKYDNGHGVTGLAQFLSFVEPKTKKSLEKYVKILINERVPFTVSYL